MDIIQIITRADVVLPLVVGIALFVAISFTPKGQRNFIATFGLLTAVFLLVMADSLSDCCRIINQVWKAHPTVIVSQDIPKVSDAYVIAKMSYPLSITVGIISLITLVSEVIPSRRRPPRQPDQTPHHPANPPAPRPPKRPPLGLEP